MKANWKPAQNPPPEDGSYFVVIDKPLMVWWDGEGPAPRDRQIKEREYIIHGRCPGDRYRVEADGPHWKGEDAEYITHWDFPPELPEPGKQPRARRASRVKG